MVFCRCERGIVQFYLLASALGRSFECSRPASLYPTGIIALCGIRGPTRARSMRFLMLRGNGRYEGREPFSVLSFSPCSPSKHPYLPHFRRRIRQ